MVTTTQVIFLLKRWSYIDSGSNPSCEIVEDIYHSCIDTSEAYVTLRNDAYIVHPRRLTKRY